LPPELKQALLCREMKWTYEEYRDQPQWFIVVLFSMLQNEAEAMKHPAKT
jgi:hypothetical protein